MRKSFRLTLTCSVILFASQLSGMDNPNDPNNNRWQINNYWQRNNHLQENNYLQGNNYWQNNQYNVRGVNNDFQNLQDMDSQRAFKEFLTRSFQTLLQDRIQMPNSAPDRGHPQQPVYMSQQSTDHYVPQPMPAYHQPAPYPQQTNTQISQLWPAGLEDALSVSGFFGQELESAKEEVNDFIGLVSQDRKFISGDSIRNTPGNFVNEVSRLEFKRRNFESRGLFSLPTGCAPFLIRMLWDLDSPEVRGWKERWEAIPGKETEKRKFNGDLASFIAMAPHNIAVSLAQNGMNFVGGCRQSLAEGFSLLHKVVDIVRELGLLAQQPQSNHLHGNP